MQRQERLILFFTAWFLTMGLDQHRRGWLGQKNAFEFLQTWHFSCRGTAQGLDEKNAQSQDPNERV